MKTITPHLWYATQAEEAARFYTGAFGSSPPGRVLRHDAASAAASGQPEGSVLTIEFELGGHPLVGLNGGPEFSFTPAVSLFVSCESREEIDRLYEHLSAGGSDLMPLRRYPFSERYVWFADRYGLSWQLNLAPATQKISPALMFVGAQHGRAEEAMRFYTSLFENSSVDRVERYGPEDADPAGGTVKYAEFTLDGQLFRAMDSSFDHDFTFNEALSFQIACEDQEAVDHFWDALTEGGAEGPCGWLEDVYGVSWQVVPAILSEMLQDGDPEKARRVSRAVFEMKKPEIGRLEAAYAGEGGETGPGSTTREER